MEFHQYLAECAQEGMTCSLIGREKLRKRYGDLLRDREEGILHAAGIAGVKAHARSLYGWDVFADQPYWSNNHRRWCGLGPVPLRSILRYRREAD